MLALKILGMSDYYEDTRRGLSIVQDWIDDAEFMLDVTETGDLATELEGPLKVLNERVSRLLNDPGPVFSSMKAACRATAVEEAADATQKALDLAPDRPEFARALAALFAVVGYTPDSTSETGTESLVLTDSGTDLSTWPSPLRETVGLVRQMVDSTIDADYSKDLAMMHGLLNMTRFLSAVWDISNPGRRTRVLTNEERLEKLAEIYDEGGDSEFADDDGILQVRAAVRGFLRAVEGKTELDDALVALFRVAGIRVPNFDESGKVIDVDAS